MTRRQHVPHYQALELEQLRQYHELLEQIEDAACDTSSQIRDSLRRYDRLPPSHQVDLFLDVQLQRDRAREWTGIHRALSEEYWAVESLIWQREDEASPLASEGARA
jgi:hypothetical protein